MRSAPDDPVRFRETTGRLERIRWLPRLDRRESGPSLGSLLVAFVISFTVAGSLALGITLAYTAVLALLHAFADKARQPKPALVLAHSQSHASGD